MAILKRSNAVPAFLAIGSFLILLFCTLLTSPIKNISYVAIFFVSLLVFMMSSLYLAVNIRAGEVTSKSRYKIFSISVFFVVLLMFRSAQSLSLIDIFILILITAGMFFYISKRANSQS
jgi:hypothetical protein